MNHIQNAMTQAAELIRKAYDAAVQAGELPEAEVRPVQIEIPKDLRNGDYASGFAMQNAKVLRQNPRKVAEILVARMELEGTCFASAEIAGPGFLNLRLSHSWFENVLTNITGHVSAHGINISNMSNGSKGDFAYTILELDEAVPAGTEEALLKIEGIIRVRTL